MKADDLATLHSELTVARAELYALTARANAQSAAYVLTYGDDMATVSGTRKKYSAGATARKFAAADREAATWRAITDKDTHIATLERRIARALRDTPVPYTDAELKAARYVRDKHSWHEVVRVNAKTVTVRTAWSWDEHLPIGDVLEIRS